MRRITQASKQDPDQAAVDRFGGWLEARLTDLGYDLSPRGGGRSRFAEETGVSPSTISRALNRKAIPGLPVLAALAKGLGVDLAEVLSLAGVATTEELHAAVDPSTSPGGRLTAHEAAAHLGITSPGQVDLFVTMVDQMRKQEADRRRGHGRRSAEQ